MKSTLTVLAVAALMLSGCSSKLTYQPEDGSPRVPVSAQHHRTADRLYVYVASEGFPVESATLVRSDGAQLAPASAIHRPSEISAGMGGKDDYSVSGGMYGGSTSPMSGSTATFGSGSIMGPGAVGGPGDARASMGTTTSRRDTAQTIVIFPADRLGPGPWRFRVKIANYPDVSIVLPEIDSAN